MLYRNNIMQKNMYLLHNIMQKKCCPFALEFKCN